MTCKYPICPPAPTTLLPFFSSTHALAKRAPKRAQSGNASRTGNDYPRFARYSSWDNSP